MTTKEDFVKEYTELCNKFGLYVRSDYCCCGGSSIAEIPKVPEGDEYEYDYDRYTEQKKDFDRQLKAK